MAAVNISVAQLRHYWPIYLLIIVPTLLVVTFSYYPIINGMVHIFYRWDGDMVEEFTGLDNMRKVFSDQELWGSFYLIFIFVITNVIKMIVPIFTAVVLHHIINDRWSYFYRVCYIIPMVVPGLIYILMWKYFYEPNTGVINTALREFGMLGPTETIAWLSDKKWVIPALIFQGFPWVGGFGVLLYLAGLQNISEDVYEAAEIDGAGPWRIFYAIELPLIMTQVRINLVLMIIGTVQSFEHIYLMVGISGGPDRVALVPGLVIFREAFSQGLFGYGCAVGFILFLITLTLTLINNKFVNVKK